MQGVQEIELADASCVMYNVLIMNDARIGLTDNQIDDLSEMGRRLYNNIFDYCTYASDPQYQTLHRFRQQITQLPAPDQHILIAYFNTDPAIQDHNMKTSAWEYFAAPYWIMDMLLICALPLFFTSCAAIYVAYWVYDLFKK